MLSRVNTLCSRVISVFDLYGFFHGVVYSTRRRIVAVVSRSVHLFPSLIVLRTHKQDHNGQFEPALEKGQLLATLQSTSTLPNSHAGKDTAVHTSLAHSQARSQARRCLG